MSNLTTEVSYEELVGAWAPLMDVSKALDRLVEKGGNAGEFFGYLDGKVKRALEPLKECIDRIVEENPDQFS